jgi:hypothetical protein
MKIYILFHGWRNNTNGYPIVAFRTKKALRGYVKRHHPDYKGVARIEPNEMYWQSEYEWLKCEDHQVKLIQ